VVILLYLLFPYNIVKVNSFIILLQMTVNSLFFSQHMKQTPIQKALSAGWKYSSYPDLTLNREVPFNTRQTYYTSIFHRNDSTTEFISEINLQFLGKNSRVFKKLI
jgi:hypothetical protein